MPNSAPHLPFEENRDHRADPEVDVRRVAAERLREVLGHGEDRDVHQQDAKQRDAAKGVDQPVPLRFGDRFRDRRGRVLDESVRHAL
jgi:hypothetical protein